MMNLLKSILILILCVTLPITHAYAVVPDPHSALNDAVEPQEQDPEINISAPSETEQAQIPNADLFQVQSIISNSSINESSIEEIQEDEGSLLNDSVIADDQKFWTSKKIVISTSLLLTTALLIGLLLLLAGGGSGGVSGGAAGGSGSAAGAGGGFSSALGGAIDGSGNNDLTLLNTNNGIPLDAHHNPEPSTFLLMGLGLLVPFFRKRLSL